jgi:hypothetical protein
VEEMMPLILVENLGVSVGHSSLPPGLPPGPGSSELLLQEIIIVSESMTSMPAVIFIFMMDFLGDMESQHFN